MSPVGLFCPDCGSSNVVEDDLYAQPQLVCVDCGSVVSEGVLAADPVGGTDISYSLSTAVTKKPCRNFKKGLQRLKAICRILKVHSEIEELSLTYFKQAYEHNSFIKVHLEKKEALAGCCVLISSRLRNWPMTMTTISCLLDMDPVMVGAIYQEMVKILNIKAPLVCITDVIEAHIQEYKIRSSQVAEEFAEDPKVLTKRAMALVELAADSWIVTGRQPVPIMMASVFLAWQSLRPTKVRLKFSLLKFCQLAKVNKHKVAMKRVTEMKEVLCKLGQEIPWIRKELTPENVAHQVEDILKHRFALLRRALRTHKEALLEECQASDEDTTPDLQSEGSAPSQISHTPHMDACEPDAKKAHVNSDTVSEQNGDTQDSEAPNWGKRVLFAPPCVTHPKKRRLQSPERNDVTGDEDISDSEIEMYIRTPQEAREFALTKKILDSAENKQ
ncbi:hypothetical protein LDENG_00145050 [Lucifuga dentata]|nr:hypothetical protein LDENG_00145050 [Lucifuga dentata]